MMTRLLIRCLLRCYPRAWRDRYGAEFAALLEEVSPGPGQLFDALRGATDAHRRGWATWLWCGEGRGMLDDDERRFWRRWTLAFLGAGLALGLVYRLAALVFAGSYAVDRRALGQDLAGLPLGLGAGQWWGLLLSARELATMPLLALVALGLGWAQRRALRPLLPTLGRRWIALALLGPLVALTVMTTDPSYSRFTDWISMTGFFLGLVGRAGGPVIARPGDPYTLGLYLLLPTVTFAGIAAVGQAYLLKGLLPRAAWWIGVAMVAAIAGLGAARLGAAFRVEGYRLAPELVRPDLLLLDTVVTVAQLGLACAVYGIVSGLGLLALRRSGQTVRPVVGELAR